MINSHERDSSALTTGLSEFYTFYDPTTAEWDGFTPIEFYHQIDCSSNVDEAHLSSSGSTAKLTGSSVQGTLSTKHGAYGSSVTMSSGQLDCFIDVLG